MIHDDTSARPTAVMLSPATYGRFEAAVKYVEGLIRTAIPRPSTGRFPMLKPGAWGLLAPGETISAGSGLTLGSGSVELLTQAGANLSQSGVHVTAYNGGPAITATAYSYGDHGEVVRLAWTEGAWAVNCWGGATPYA